MTTKEELKNLPRWNLSDLYPGKDSKEIKADMINTADRARRFQKLFQGKLAELDGDILASTFREFEEITEVLGRISSFASLLYAENVTDSENAAFNQNTSEKITDIYSSLLFFTLEINKIDEAELDIKIRKSAKLRHYASFIRDVRVMRPHQLSDEVEQMLMEKSITSSQSWSRLFEETIADLKFPFDKEVLSCAEIMNLMSNQDPVVRKKAAKSIGKVFGDNIRIFSFITNILAKDKEMEDKWRHFKEPISSRNLSNLIEDDVAQALIDTVKNNYDKLAHRYYKIKAKAFGKKHLEYWDRNAPMPGENTKLIQWDEAVDLVLGAYHDFSPAMANIGKRFFIEKWVDAPAVPGKDPGAFSASTVPGVHPYILMNYQGKIRDVMTLAHELGHGVHQVLAAEQGYLMSSTPLTLAETASVFGEQLTFRAMIKREKNEEQRKIMISNKVGDMLNTVVRQIAFCDFEKQVHDRRKHGEISTEDICSIWMNVQKEALGPAIKFDDEYKYYWAYIPHFIHTPFYVYAYAFGDCLVNSLYRVYQEFPNGFVDKYIDMLKAGGTLRHKELLAPFGLDASNPNFWQGGLDVISGFIDQLEE